MATEPQMDESERKIVNEFCHHLEKSKQLFNGLRFDLLFLSIFIIMTLMARLVFILWIVETVSAATRNAESNAKWTCLMPLMEGMLLHWHKNDTIDSL